MSDKPSNSTNPDDAVVEPAEVELESQASEGTPATTAERRPVAEAEAEVHVEVPKSTFWRDLLWATPSWVLSMVIHIIMLLVLAMFYLPANSLDDMRELLLATGDDDVLEELEDFD